MVGREPARRRVAAAAPCRVARPVVDRDAVLHAEPHRVGVVRVRLGELELLLEQAGAAAGVDQPARFGTLAARRLDAVGDAMRAPSASPRSMARDDGAVDEGDAAPRGLLGEEVLEDAAVDLVARHREEAAGADLGHGVDVAPAFGGEEAKAELLQLALLEVRLQAEHLARNSRRRSRPTIRRPCAPPPAPDAGAARARRCRARRTIASAGAPGSGRPGRRRR